MADFYFETRGLCVGYDGQTLIRDISIGVEKGEIVSLIGPNGSGKSTILKSITRQLKSIGGTVWLGGGELSGFSLRGLAQRMAVVLTERLRPELMSCWDVAASGRYPYTGRLGLLDGEDKLKVRAALEAVHALELAQKDFNAVSDGQRQRVLLARAICQEPEIIVLDEPTSYLDIRHKLELLSILRDMAKEKGITVIMSLHEIDLAQKISDKILCVKGDYLSHYGPPEEVFKEENIRALYGMERGFFDPLFGNIELPRPEGRPRAFVLSACGTGIPVYRALQKKGVPFCAGILFTNDVDYRLARLLAGEVVTARPFHEIDFETLKRAKAMVDACEYVIDAGVEIGPGNRAMAELREYARACGKLKEDI